MQSSQSKKLKPPSDKADGVKDDAPKTPQLDKVASFYETKSNLQDSAPSLSIGFGPYANRRENARHYAVEVNLFFASSE